MTIKPATKPDYVIQESILSVTHTENGKKITRTYDFRNSGGRHAYMRFCSWALANQMTFECHPTYIIATK